jgi:hypothetical protein
MQMTLFHASYDLKLPDLLAVAVFIGGVHYLSSLLSDYHSATSIAGVTDSAYVGLTAAVGVLAYSTYRFFRPQPL